MSFGSDAVVSGYYDSRGKADKIKTRVVSADTSEEVAIMAISCSDLLRQGMKGNGYSHKLHRCIDASQHLDAAALEAASRAALARMGWDAANDDLVVSHLLAQMVSSEQKRHVRKTVAEICRRYERQAIPRLVEALELFPNPLQFSPCLCDIAKELGDAVVSPLISLAQRLLIAGKMTAFFVLDVLVARQSVAVADLVWDSLRECVDLDGRLDLACLVGRLCPADRVVSALEDPDETTRGLAVSVLDALQHPELERLLFRALGDPSPLVRATAALILARCKDIASADALASQLAVPDEHIRVASAFILAERGDSRGAGVLVDDVKRETCDRAEWMQGVQSLAKQDSPLALDIMLKAATDTDPEIREAAMAGLARIGDRRAIPTLRAAATDGNEGVRRAAFAALAAFPERAVIELLGKSMVEHKEWPAAVALARIDDPRAIRLLDHALDNPDVDVRSGASYALGRCANAEAVDLLIRATRDPEERVRDNAVEALDLLGDRRATQALVSTLMSTSSFNTRWRASCALGKLGWVPETDGQRVAFLLAQGDSEGCVAIGPGAVPALVDFLHHPEEGDQTKACRALWKLGWNEFDKDEHTDKWTPRCLWLGLLRGQADSTTLAAILRFCSDANKNHEDALRRRLRTVYVHWDDKRLNLLLSAIRDDTRCLQEAIEVLAEIGDDMAASCLVALLKSSNRGMAVGACRALGKVRNDLAVEALLHLAEGEDEAFVRAARAALMETTDPRALPVAAAVVREAKAGYSGSAFQYLIRLGAPAVETLLSMLHQEGVNKDDVIRALLGVFPPRMIQPLIEALARPDARQMAEFALALIVGIHFDGDQGKWRAWWAENKYRLMATSEQVRLGET